MSADEPAGNPAQSHPDFDAQVNGIAALGDPVRRSLYRFVVAQTAPVTREQAAAGVGVARHIAKFHLDRLLEEGLLDVTYARPAGRSGPGAGRPAKLYQRSARALAVSLPPREYELAGRLLAHAITTAERDGVPVGQALGEAAREVGLSIGRRARQQAGSRPSRASLVAATNTVLSECGYEPRADAEGVTLANCPFHALAQDYTDLVCGMNLELMTGVVEGLETSGLEARLEPCPGQCCVRLAPM